MMRYEIIHFNNPAAIGKLVVGLIAQHRQFSVAPFPNGLKTEERTGWIVSWPDRTGNETHPRSAA